MKKKAHRTMRVKKDWELYDRANKHWSAGRLRLAFKLFLAAANAGIVKAFGNVAQFYHYGTGVVADEDAALCWYRRAVRENKDASSANNIGCIWRDRGNLGRALWWFSKAVEMGDCQSNLNIAKIYLDYKHNSRIAIPYLIKVAKSRSRYVTEGGKEEAAVLLKQVSKEKVKSTAFRRRNT